MILLLLLTTLLLLLLTYFYLSLFPHPLPLIPHDPSSTTRPFGDAPVVKSLGQRTREPSAAVFAQCRKLSAPLVQFLLTSLPFTQPAFILDDPREVEDILLRRNKEFDRSKLTTHLFSQILPESTLAQLTTERLKKQKRLWSDVMNPDFLRRVVAPNLQIAAQELVELWAAKGESHAFEVSADFQSTALDAIWVAVLGQRIGVLRGEIRKVKGEKRDEETERLVELVRFAVEKGSAIVNAGVGSLVPAVTFWLMSWTGSYRRFKRVGREEVKGIMKRAGERFRRMGEGERGEEDTCAMDFVLRREIAMAKKEGREAEDPVENPAMLDELWLLLLAGHDSTASTLAWFVKFLGRNQAVQRQLREAVKGVFGGKKFPTSGEISEADIPLLDATIEETLRCAATASITTRRVLVDTKVLGYDIPKGSNILLNLRVDKTPLDVEESRRSSTSQAAQLKRAQGGFDGPSGQDLDSFEPRRWLAQDSTNSKEVFDAYALPTLTFGGGFRGCFGKRLAMLELRIIITTLMLNFEFLPLPEAISSMEAEEEVFRKPKTAYVKLRAL